MKGLSQGMPFKVGLVLLSFTLALFSIAPSISAATNDEDFTKDELKEIKKMEQELEFYFEVVGEFDEDGKYIVKDKELFQQKLDEQDSSAIELQKLIETYEIYEGERYLQPFGAVDFGKCVVNKMVNSYGNIARQFLNGSIFIYIKNKQYDLAARLIFKTLIKAGFKVNAVSIAAELAIYGWQCRGSW